MISSLMLFVSVRGAQAECDVLAQRAEAMKEENASLGAEVTRIRSEYEQLLAQNAALKVLSNA